MAEITVYTDGAARGNPGPSASGYIICEDGKAIKESSSLNGTATNNTAEYTAMIDALEWCSKNLQNPKNLRLSVVSDSQLVVRQMTGKYKTKSATLKPLMKRLLGLCGSFKSVKFESRPRTDPMISKVDKSLNNLLDMLDS